MHESVHDALAADFETYRSVRRIHDVPPHEVHEVRVDGRRAVCKYDVGPTGSAGVEGRVMRFVAEHTSVPVPTVMQVGANHFLAAWHPEAPDPDADSEPDVAWARAAGRGLAILHEETEPIVDGYGRFQVDGDSVVPVGHDTWHDAAVAYVRRHRTVPAANGHDDVVDAVLDHLQSHPEAFADAGDPVCCHGWWTPEHVAVRDGRVACVVDFEHAIAAPPGFDYWRTVIPAFDDDTADARRAFREGYESVRELPATTDRHERLYALLAQVYYLESLYVQSQHDPNATAERARWFSDRITDTLDALE